MIVSGELTLEQRRRSQRAMLCFDCINGLSYMCLGETIIILLAVRLGCPDYVISTLGALIFLSYVLLPFGKTVAARVGAAWCQGVFWVARNIAALVVASSVLWSRYGHPGIATASLLSGALVFYGCRAAGIVMTQPLAGNVSVEEERPSFLANKSMLAYLGNLIALIGISVFLMHREGIWPLFWVIIAGITFGLTATTFLRRVVESESLRLAAAKPLWNGVVWTFHDTTARKQILSTLCWNTIHIMTVPISMLVVKRGYGVSDLDALAYSVAQTLGSVLVPKLAVPLMRRYGPRKMLMCYYLIYLVLAGAWVFSPDTPHNLFLFPAFFLFGGIRANGENANTHYFLQTIEQDHQVNAAITIATCAGCIGGFIASTLAGTLLTCTERLFPGEGVYHYRFYFLFTSILLLPGYLAIHTLKPLPKEKRLFHLHWHPFWHHRS